MLAKQVNISISFLDVTRKVVTSAGSVAHYLSAPVKREPTSETPAT